MPSTQSSNTRLKPTTTPTPAKSPASVQKTSTSSQAAASKSTASAKASADKTSTQWAAKKSDGTSLRGKLLPDFAHDGKVVNLATGKTADFSVKAMRDAVYTPAGAAGRAPLVFTEGANQWLEVAQGRAKTHADTLKLPMVVVHNASFVKETPGQNSTLKNISRGIEGISNALLTKNLTTEKSVKSLSTAMLDAVETGKPAYFGGESQGTMLVGQALNQSKKDYIKKHAPSNGKGDVAVATKAWEKKAGENLNVLTFGNAYQSYPKGPNYVHVMMKGDPVVKNGSRPDNVPADAKTQYMVFDQLFAGKNFENHNIALLTNLLKRTGEMNGFEAGDMRALFGANQAAQRSGKPLTMATPADVSWPKDINSQMWNSKSNVAESVANYKAERR
jgi:hypothetical protein